MIGSLNFAFSKCYADMYVYIHMYIYSSHYWTILGQVS